MIQTTAEPAYAAARGQARQDGDRPVEHANPNRHGHRPAHPQAEASLLHSAPAAPSPSASWRFANSRKPDTLLPDHGGAFSNGDRRRTRARAEFHGH